MILLDVRYDHKQIFEQCKNMDHQSISVRNIMIYLNQLHHQKMCLQNSEWLGAVPTQGKQSVAFSLRSLHEEGRSRWWCWKLCTTNLNPSSIFLGVKITVEANLKLVESWFQKFTFHHVMINLQRYSPNAKYQWDVKVHLAHSEGDPSHISATETNIKHITVQVSCLFK